MNILNTNRLSISQLSLTDAQFIIRLTNTEGWMKNIGNRNTNTEAGALAYLNKGPLQSYATTGYGLWKISLLESGQPIGMCGIFKREGNDHPDIGYAILPEFEGKGYTSEAAQAVKDYAVSQLGIANLIGITDPGNAASIAILEKIGMEYRKNIQLKEDAIELKLFSLIPL